MRTPRLLVRKSIAIAVLPAGAPAPTPVERLLNNATRLRRFSGRLAIHGEFRVRYEAGGVGYVLQRALRDRGHTGEVIAPSLIPTKPGVQHKHDKCDAVQLARLHRARKLTPARIPTEADVRVRDVERCRESFQREIVKSRPYLQQRDNRGGGR